MATYASCCDQEIRPRSPLLSPNEVLTLAILSQWPRFCSERDFFGFADAHLRGYSPVFSATASSTAADVLSSRAESSTAQPGRNTADGSKACRVLDTTLIPAIVRVRACRTGLFVGQATSGRSVSRTGWIYGFKAALTVTPESIVTTFGLAPANCDEKPRGEFLMASDRYDSYLADKGFSSVEREKHWLES